MKKILFVIDSLRRGGKERQFVELIKNLPSKYQIYLIVFSKNIEYKEIINRVNFFIHFDHRKTRNFLTQIIALNKILTIQKPNLIHTWDHISSLYFGLIKFIHQTTIINGAIRYALPIKKTSKLGLISSIGFIFSDVIIANSKAGLKSHNLLNNPKARVIYNGFDFGRITSVNVKEIKRSLNLSRKFVVGMVANFLHSKDHKSLIYAGNELISQGYDIDFVFIGDGPTLSSIKKIILEENKNYFHFLGKRSDVEKIIPVFDLGVLLSNEGHAEGISNSLTEIMACGIPVIATDTGGNIELIKNNFNGFLVPLFGIDEIINGIKFFYNNKGEKIQFGLNAKETIRKHFSVQRMVSDYCDLYNKLG